MIHEEAHCRWRGARSSAKMNKETGSPGIAWREWSKESFEEARISNRLVLLDLSAEWCHWCHVMDDTTYSDRAVIAQINENFIPIRVDIDERPDISERYNRGGFPTTAFLSDMGESVWGATYIPPVDMKRIIASILAAKAAGEVDAALERSRMQYLDISKAIGQRTPPDRAFVDSLFEDIFSAYDVEHGGFGLYPKFPHPDVLDLLMIRYAQSGDQEIADAVIHTLDRMTEGLYDPAEGGVFRYSVSRDWKEPHYEKMLETNLGFLRNLIRAAIILGKPNYQQTARGVANYLLGTLRDLTSGGFFSSQDADEAYYRLALDERTQRGAPPVVRAIYGGWNSEAVATLAEAGAVVGEPDWVQAAKDAWEYDLSKLWDGKNGLLRHAEGKRLFLFEDQVSFLEAILAIYELTGEDSLLDLGKVLTNGVKSHFAHPDGGYSDIVKDSNAVGELADQRRSLVSNSKWARASALLAAASNEPEPARRQMEIIDSFSHREVEMYGLFSSSYLVAWSVLEEGPSIVEVRSDKPLDAITNELWTVAKRAMKPSTLVVMKPSGPDLPDGRPGSSAMVCASDGCSVQIRDPKALANRLRGVQPSQV